MLAFGMEKQKNVCLPPSLCLVPLDLNGFLCLSMCRGSPMRRGPSAGLVISTAPSSNVNGNAVAAPTPTPLDAFDAFDAIASPQAGDLPSSSTGQATGSLYPKI